MRTTLTLDEDVAAKLKAQVGRSGRPFKQVVNELLRSALKPPPRLKPRKPFRVKARALGLRPGLRYESVGDLLAEIEGASHK